MEQKFIKSIFMMTVILVMCMALFSCDKDVVTIGTSGYSTLELDRYYLEFKPGDGSKEIKVSSQEAWTYTVDENWAYVTREGDSNKLMIMVDENRTKETRECILEITSSSDSQIKRTVKISQLSSLITLSCSETELNFSAYEGAYEILSVKSNGEWKVRRTPEWLRASVSGGNGNKQISFTTLSANKTSVDRSGYVVIGTSDDEVQVFVRQYGGVMSNCQVKPKNITVLSNGIAFDMDYSRAGNVAHYYRGYIEASRIGSMTNQEIISTLQREFQRHLPSDDEVADFSDLKPNTSYIIFTLAYDMEGQRGDLLSTEVKTCMEDVNDPCGWISSLRSTGTYWEWSITKSATCYSYWMMTTEDYTVAHASDVLQAWWMEDAIRRNLITEYYNGGDWQKKREGGMFAVWTRGKTANGKWSGKITWKGCEESSSTATRSTGTEVSSFCTIIKQHVTRDGSGKKLSPDQYRLYSVR